MRSAGQQTLEQHTVAPAIYARAIFHVLYPFLGEDELDALQVRTRDPLDPCALLSKFLHLMFDCASEYAARVQLVR